MMKLVKQLRFVKVTEESSLEGQLTPSQCKTWKNIKTGFEELKMIEEGKLKGQSAEKFLQELKEEGYL
ncbi:MAG: hypothetical protein U0Y10_23690 [Spirosomataceae bacterium]